MPRLAVARRPRTVPVAPVTWRDGVHLTGTPIWCDARRRRDVCFVSSAERVGRTGHGQLIATPLTLALLGTDAGHLAVPVHRPFTLGTTRLQLIPSGRGLGAAALHVDLGGRTVLYAGAVRVDGSEAAEVRTSDAVVVGAPIGKGPRKLEKLDKVVDRLATWVRAQLAAARMAIVVVDTVFDGLEVAEQLAAAGVTAAASRGIREAGVRASALAHVPALRAPGREPACVIRVEQERMKLPEGVKAANALVSIRALELAAETSPGWDGAFAWPFVADRKQLLEWIEQTRAKDVFLVGAHAEDIAGELGSRARVLGPPHQMALFGS